MLWRDFKVWQIYGANTNVGKTIAATILCRALQRRVPNGVFYLKPVSTGPPEEADDGHLKRQARGIVSKVLASFRQPVSPHLAARDQWAKVDDATLIDNVRRALAQQLNAGLRYAFLETAGGVLSPGPSGTVQADLYRPLHLPTLLVGDSKLGGIATTISAFESLHVRGYYVDSVLVFQDPKWGNFEYLREHFAKHEIEAHPLPLPPARRENASDDEQAMDDYYTECLASPTIDALLDQLNRKHFSRVSKLMSLPSQAESVIWHPFRQHGLPQNTIAIDSAYNDHFEAYNQETDAAVINAANPTGPSLNPISSASDPSRPLTTPLFDASASWWTQGLGHGNPTLALTAANAAGRFGHVMFAGAVHEPALDLCHNLLSTLANPRLSRIFFTDNGSTGMEVAVKMALRASCARYGWRKDDDGHPIEILGLRGSYHGDTIGVMNCSEPSTFNDKVDWYKPQGYWFEPPQVLMRNGEWVVLLDGFGSAGDDPRKLSFPSLSALFDFPSRKEDANFYEGFISRTLHHLSVEKKRRFGALIMEPVIMGAGGMIFVDPLFQRMLIETVRNKPHLISPDDAPFESMDALSAEWSGLPVIADEVFTGLYRLGRPSSSSFLSAPSTDVVNKSSLQYDILPDISVHAKLLTGGVLPLALTAASQSIFNTFLSESKTDALLHGHSYTAHPVGCSVANKSLSQMKDLHDTNAAWRQYRAAWDATMLPRSSSLEGSKTDLKQATGQEQEISNEIFSFFSPPFVTRLSDHPVLSGVWSLGTVLAITLRSKPEPGQEDDPLVRIEGESGYNSNAAASLQKRLLESLDSRGAAIHSRVLGDVLYIMTSLTTTSDEVMRLEKFLWDALEQESEERERMIGLS